MTLRDGRFGPYVQLGEGEKPKRSSLPKGMTHGRRRRSKRRSRCCRCRARSRNIPTTGEPILAGIGRYGPYVQHGKTYANLGRDDDVLAIGANRAIDLIVTEGTGRRRRGASAQRAGRELGDHPQGGKSP